MSNIKIPECVPAFLHHTVVTDVKTVEEFLDKYYKPERYRGRGDVYAASLLNSYQNEFETTGYCSTSSHDNVRGRFITFAGDLTGGDDETKN